MVHGKYGAKGCVFLRNSRYSYDRSGGGNEENEEAIREL